MSSLTRIVPDIGIHRGISNHIYHNAWDAASNGQLTKLRRSPAHLKAYLDEPPTSTDALRVGRAIHTAILEPDLFDAEFVVAGRCEATKKGDGQRCANGGAEYHEQLGWLCGIHLKGVPPVLDQRRVVLSSGDYAMCQAVRSSVFRHRAAIGLLGSAGDAELSLVWNDAEFDVRCKARLDWHAPALVNGAIADIKSTADASPSAFERSIFDYGYHRQAAMYLDACATLGLPAQHFYVIAVEKEPPFAAAVFCLRADAIDAGRQQLRRALATYRACAETGHWPAYSDQVTEISLPPWAWKQIDQELLIGAVA